MATLNSPALRTVDVARESRYSVQQVRDLERAGVLPPADRTASGYRRYREIHVRSALAYRALAAGVGPVEAKPIMRAVHESPQRMVLGLLDAAHAGLSHERGELELARTAAEAISGEPIENVQPADAMSVAELAAALGVRGSTLRYWDAEGLVVPDRIAPRGTRSYAPEHARDARIVQQLRAAGYGVPAVRSLLPDLRRGRRSAELSEALSARDASIERRSLALLEASAELSAVFALRARPASRAGTGHVG